MESIENASTRMQTINRKPGFPKVCILGEFSFVNANGHEVPINSKKVKLLIAILAYNKGKKLQRNHVAEILWSRHAEENALTSLRQALTKLKQIIGVDYNQVVVSERRYLSLHPNVETDFESINSESFAASRKHKTTPIWRKKAFEDLESRESRIVEWVDNGRRSIARQIISQLNNEIKLLNSNLPMKGEMKVVEELKQDREFLYNLYAAQLTDLEANNRDPGYPGDKTRKNNKLSRMYQESTPTTPFTNQVFDRRKPATKPHVIAEEKINCFVDKNINAYLNGLDNNQNEPVFRYLPKLAKSIDNRGESKFILENLSHQDLETPFLIFLAKLLPILLIGLISVGTLSYFAYLYSNNIQSLLIPLAPTVFACLALAIIGETGETKLLPTISIKLAALKNNFKVKMAIIFYGTFSIAAFTWMIYGIEACLAMGAGSFFSFLLYSCLNFQNPKSEGATFKHFNERLHKTFRSSIAGLTIGLIIGQLIDFYLRNILISGSATLFFSSILFFLTGGHAVLQHYLIRVLLYSTGKAPLNYGKFLKECCKNNLLMKKGDGVCFSDHSTLNYFANHSFQKL